MIIEYIIIGILIIIIIIQRISFIRLYRCWASERVKGLGFIRQKDNRYSIPCDFTIEPGEIKTFHFNFAKKNIKEEENK